ncbi:MAG: methyltransferase domain-containing protein [Magnetococcales bacterium]|nr:methyltransferase domain-containing protein [Magnetococcales bacterium]
MVFSIGVIHHLENPELAVRNMAKACKPGGRVLIWLYGEENNGWIVHLFNPVRRHLFSRLPIRLNNGLAWGLTGILWSMLKFGFGKQPYYDFLRRIPFQHLKHIVLDHMLPKIALYYRRDQAAALLAQAGLQEIHSEWVNQISWSVCGKKI